MATDIHHAMSSARKWGGTASDFMPIHRFFDSSKRSYADFRHRALFHHAEGIALCVRLFGDLWTIQSTGRQIPTRWIAEQHVREDFGGRIPTAADWLSQIKPQRWMSAEALKLSREFEHVTTIVLEPEHPELGGGQPAPG